jgi:hypothetical protein
MTLVAHVEFSGFEIQIGDGADPEVFTPKCTLNSSRGFTLSGETTSRNIPDCTDDLLPSKTLNYVTAIGGEISGSGVLEKADDKFFADWLNSGAAKNCKVRVGGTGGTQYAGAFKITSLSVTAETKDVVNAEITLVSHGAVTVTAIS